MNQPTAPCSPPSTNSRARRGRSRRSILSGRPKPDQRHNEGQPDQPAPQPMGPFQPEDLLEAGEAEALVHQGVLRDLLVEVVQPLPFRVVHRRQRAGERRPFHDRKAGAGQAGDAAQHDHHQDHECDGEQPGRDAAGGCDGRPRGLPAEHRESRTSNGMARYIGVRPGPARIPGEGRLCSVQAQIGAGARIRRRLDQARGRNAHRVHLAIQLRCQKSRNLCSSESEGRGPAPARCRSAGCPDNPAYGSRISAVVRR